MNKEISRLKKELGIDEWLELCKEDKNLNGGYVSFGQYIYILEQRLEEKEKVIDEIEKRCNQEIKIATFQYKERKRNNTWQYIIAHKRILEILERGKNEIRKRNYNK